jgi:beta-glucanase (GH16 family)
MTRPTLSIRPFHNVALPATIACTILLLLGPTAQVARAEPMPVGVPGTWSLRFDEEFNSFGINTSVWTKGWQHEGISGPMSKDCLSSALATQPGDGSLHLSLSAERHECEGTSNNYTGGLVESNPGDGVPGHSGFSYLYGYVEWRAYVGGSQGGPLPDWPALWSEPANQGTNHSSEIDTMEGLSGQPCFHYHWFLEPQENFGGCATGGYAGGWHTYGVDWEPGSVTFYYDGRNVGAEYENHPLPQYLIMDMIAPEPARGSPVGDEMKIDYVRVWQHPVPPPAPNVKVSTVETPSGEVLAFGHNSAGELLEFSQSTSGTWELSNLTALSPGNPDISGAPSAMVGYGGEVLVFANTPSGELIAYNNCCGGWHAEDVSAESPGDPHISGAPSAMVGHGGETLVFANSPSGELIDFIATGIWTTHDVSGESAGDPHISGPPSAELGHGGELLVFANTPSGELIDFVDCCGSWHSSNVSAESHAALISGAPSATVYPGGQLVVFANSASPGELIDFVDCCGSWHSSNVSAESHAAQISGAPSATVSSHEELLVFANSPSGDMIDFVDCCGSWHSSNVSAETSGDPHITGMPTTMARAASGEPLVFAANPAGELLEFAATGIWSDTDLTALTGGTAFLSG